MSLKVLAVTGSRADWGLLSTFFTKMEADSFFDLHICATGQHTLQSGFSSLDLIKAHMFTNLHIVPLDLPDDSQKSTAQALGDLTIKSAALLDEIAPDVLVVLGDRYEIVSFVQAALLLNIPVAHLCGGDTTEGAIDEQIRHAVTKFSHLHFVTNSESEERVKRMGENPDHIFNVGSPGLDLIASTEFLSKAEFFSRINFEPREYNFMVTYHPVTLEQQSEIECMQMLEALDELGDDFGFIITGSNADPGVQDIDMMTRVFSKSHSNACFHTSLGSFLYFNALHHCNGVIGNSSSGLYEAPSFGIPTINIGNRQKGRLKASSVIDCVAEKKQIKDTVMQVLDIDYSDVKNPYGDGNTSEAIIDVLRNFDWTKSLVQKSFFNN